MTVPDPYGISVFHGKRLDNATIAALKMAEAELGYELTITQGIGTSVDASAGTHAKGRTVDLSPYDAARKLRVLKDIGFAIYRRPTIRGLWSEHLHGCLILESVDNQRGIAASAWRQIKSFIAKRDGLKSNRADDSYRPPGGFNVFHYPPKDSAMATRTALKTPLAEAKDQLVVAAHALGVAAIKFEQAKRPSKSGKVRFSGYATTARAIRRSANALLAVLPPK